VSGREVIIMSTSMPKSGQLNFLLEGQHQKKCNECKKVLPSTEFYTRTKKNNRKVLDYACRSCKNKKDMIYRRNNLEKTMLKRLKNRAEKKNVPVSITAGYLKKFIPDDMICPVLGIKMEVGQKISNVNSPSIDRIIPEKGYVPGNIIIVSMKANQIKTSATPDEIIKVGKFYKKLLEEMEDGSETD
jgi:hypothetical protein